MAENELPACRECGHRAHWLGTHVTEAHGLSVDAYAGKHPKAPLASASALREMTRAVGDRTNRVHPPPADSLTTVFAGIRTRVNPDVPVDGCLQLPKAYRIPTHGYLAEDVKDATTSLVRGRSVYVWGPQGTGKDAFFHAFSYMTRTPALLFQMQPSEDNRAWFFSHEFNKDGTFWEEGRLLKALRYGYTTTTGRVIPYMILITDFDRATKEQAEGLRLVLDSIEGRVSGPGGVVYNVVPGTQIVMTANTAGAGDERGRYVSANVIDSSILDRIDRAYMFHLMDWADEEPVLKAKFPLLVEKCPGVFKQAGDATGKLREAIRAETLYTEFSHRAVCAWLGAAEDIIAVSDSVPEGLMKRAFRVVKDKMPDQEVRDSAERIVDPYLVGGAIPGGGAPGRRGAGARPR